jgi:hypothetical protein
MPTYDFIASGSIVYLVKDVEASMVDSSYKEKICAYSPHDARRLRDELDKAINVAEMAEKVHYQKKLKELQVQRNALDVQILELQIQLGGDYDYTEEGEGESSNG